jgi:hypothetical protein
VVVLISDQATGEISDQATGEPALAVIIEPQLRDSETKRYCRPVYVATARRVAERPAAVLVLLCPDPDEAAKCRRLIRTGRPGFDLAPVVIDSADPPGQASSAGPYLTVFAAGMGGTVLEAMMTTSEYEKTFIERIHDYGIAEGEARARPRLSCDSWRHAGPPRRTGRHHSTTRRLRPVPRGFARTAAALLYVSDREDG